MEHFKLVEDAFFNEIKRVFGSKPDIYSWLKNHERIPLLMTNLKKEIVTTELKNARLITTDSLKMIGKEFAHTFAKFAVDQKESELMTEAEKQRRLHELHEWNEIGEMLEEGDETVQTYNNGNITTQES